MFIRNLDTAAAEARAEQKDITPVKSESRSAVTPSRSAVTPSRSAVTPSRSASSSDAKGGGELTGNRDHLRDNKSNSSSSSSSSSDSSSGSNNNSSSSSSSNNNNSSNSSSSSNGGGGRADCKGGSSANEDNGAFLSASAKATRYRDRKIMKGMTEYLFDLFDANMMEEVCMRGSISSNHSPIIRL